jgi:hypothetical protein
MFQCRSKVAIVSSVRHAGNMPVADSNPSDGLSPTIPFMPAGMRPEPAVSVPSEKSTIPAASATAAPNWTPRHEVGAKDIPLIKSVARMTKLAPASALGSRSKS